MEFHVSKKARTAYRLEDTLFSLSGNVISLNIAEARRLVQQMNDVRQIDRYPERTVRTGQVLAMGLIDEILHYVVRLYRQQVQGTVMTDALAWLRERFGDEALDRTFSLFVSEFPGSDLWQGKTEIAPYLEGTTEGVPNREVIVEEMLLLWLANMNPAFGPFRELFDDSPLKEKELYLSVIHELWEFFETRSSFGPQNQKLISLLRSPAVEVPHSLQGQLEYIYRHWGYLLADYVTRLLQSLDIFREEEKLPFGGPGPVPVSDYRGLESEHEQFSPDRDWMPHLVLLAKNTYVWLHQLSVTYGSDIYRLDHVPDDELDRIQRAGFTGLWLIGLWERSPASQRIKQLCGNPEAVPSAYSLYDYQIANDLGGDGAYQNLRDRCWERGIRLASDMVPNHVGIVSRWMIDHPDWFVSLHYNPFPWYTYHGPDLSTDRGLSVFLEDHYYDRTDAAVVFKTVDRQTGNERFVYHGNDGTSMPWNDTAQLNYLNAEVREAMIQSILYVAKKFPVIRFDAAMTLAKKHYQRLWFPEPGTGGAIPTRAEHSLSRDAFDNAMPREFWREVVDRVAAEAPDTLLLAEAFWLLEGFFVRTLGMHRVYNSAFMNMLRDEENSGYRSVIKNTLEFDPEILRRFVNFMNNPDERTAIDQFGKDDKYFGVCTIMATMPGLPMFGHGQVEGYSEKYGMEYRRAYWNEEPDPYLIERHEREIFPLLRKRHLFSGVENFLLYDFFGPDGSVNEDVFAYSNRAGDERSLAIYHNRYATARGWIRTSVGYSVKGPGDSGRVLRQDSLSHGLSLTNSKGCYLSFRDNIKDEWYLRSIDDINANGLFFELGAYKYNVFVDFAEIEENEWNHWGRLNYYLGGRGVPSLYDTLRVMLEESVRSEFLKFFAAPLRDDIMELMTRPAHQETQGTGTEPSVRIDQRLSGLFSEIFSRFSIRENAWKKAVEVRGNLSGRTSAFHSIIGDLDGRSIPLVRTCLAIFFFVDEIDNQIAPLLPSGSGSTSLFDILSLGSEVQKGLEGSGFSGSDAFAAVNLLHLIFRWHPETGKAQDLPSAIAVLLTDREAEAFFGVNTHDDIRWFRKEVFEWLVAALTVLYIDEKGRFRQDRTSVVREARTLLALSHQSEYQFDRLVEGLRTTPSA